MYDQPHYQDKSLFLLVVFYFGCQELMHAYKTAHAHDIIVLTKSCFFYLQNLHFK